MEIRLGYVGLRKAAPLGKPRTWSSCESARGSTQRRAGWVDGERKESVTEEERRSEQEERRRWQRVVGGCLRL